MEKPYESLKLFYLGRDEHTSPILYENKDLTTHALVIGMTGSGKTGLGIGLIEEACIDNIPSIVIDPKGDMGNLLLAFEDLSPAQFKPWIDESEAKSKGVSVDELATSTANLWKKGIESWDMDKSRVKKYKDSADFTIYSPGASYGVGVSVLSSFKAPPKELVEDSDFFNQLISSTVTGVLGFVGIDADPLSSKEHILLSTIFAVKYSNGEDLSLEELIHSIINPPFDKIGVFSLDKFFPQDKRVELAMKINSIVASPSFASWCTGEVLDISKLMFTKEGKARVSVFSISHLSDKERMFFVTLLLNAIIGWMRQLEGTSSLRAILYMDEIFGFFPPNANPSSKMPMLTLLKQARAYGLGVVLSTQNPVDLDYKGLSNIGTWFVGRLQTTQDKQRVIDGLSGISGSNFSKSELMEVISNLGKRRFLLKNIHEDGLKIMQTRWALSYLKGPLSRDQIKSLMSQKLGEKSLQSKETKKEQSLSSKPLITSDIEQLYLYETMSENPRLEPVLMAFPKVRFVSTRAGIDEQKEFCISMSISKESTNRVWEVEEISRKRLLKEPREKAEYDDVEAGVNTPAFLKKMQGSASEYIYSNVRLTNYSVPALKLISKQGESIEEFRGRIQTRLNELVDEGAVKLKAGFETKVKVLEQRAMRLRLRLEKEKGDVKSKSLDTALSFGSILLGTLFGGGSSRAGNMGKATGGVKNANRVLKERADVQRVEEEIAAVNMDIENLKNKLRDDASFLSQRYSMDSVEIKEDSITPRKSDISAVELVLVWREV